MSTNNAPIGIFDSGVGGLTVARAIIDQLPGESILYIGDTARGPYGPKSLADVRSYALEIMDELVKAGVKARDAIKAKAKDKAMPDAEAKAVAKSKVKTKAKAKIKN